VGKSVGWLLGVLNGMLLLQRKHGSVGLKQRWCGVNPFECWRVPQSLEKGGNAFRHVASVDHNLYHKLDHGHFSKYKKFPK
jgi:hypothetical protein